MKKYLAIILQGFCAFIGFIISLMIANVISPIPQFITEKTPETGFLSMPVAMVFNGFVNAVILIWAARRSSFKAFALMGQLFVLSFVAQTFQTQIETGYFLSAFPLLSNNFEIYRLILRGFITSAVFAALVTLTVGGFSKAPRPASNFTVPADRAVKHSSWLAVVYLILYLLFGYYLAWQSQELRLFYGSPGEMKSFVDQWLTSFMGKPELPLFQYFRGVIWILCLIPLFKGFSGGRVELVILSGLALGFLPTMQLAFPNPLMPAGVSLYHFWEILISTGIFGALCAWFIPIELNPN
jgi:hypothetical protein